MSSLTGVKQVIVPDDLKAAFEELCIAQRHHLGVKISIAPESEIIEAMVERERARAKFDRQLENLKPQRK